MSSSWDVPLSTRFITGGDTSTKLWSTDHASSSYDRPIEIDPPTRDLTGESISIRSTATSSPSRRLLVQGPPIDTKPKYNQIHGPLGKTLDSLFLSIFRTKMEQVTMITSTLPKDDYQGLMEVANQMTKKYSKPQVRELSRQILRSLFPSWLPSAFRQMFAIPLPAFSAVMNAYATYVAGTWLMGECQVRDYTTDEGVVKANHALHVKRCRFLEESGCASVCIHACKLPTQDFFRQDMGLNLTMTPNYDTFECEFQFGTNVDDAKEQSLFHTPCLSRCSMKLMKPLERYSWQEQEGESFGATTTETAKQFNVPEAQEPQTEPIKMSSPEQNNTITCVLMTDKESL